MKNIPPLNSLRAFVVAAKYKSFTKAAPALGVTQGAVSKQIHILENYLGFSLFERQHQNLVLTNSAKIYLASINEVFDIIERATSELTKKDDKNILNVNILPSLASRWLIPLITYFSNKYNVNVEIGSGYDSVDFDSTNTNIAVRIVKKGKSWKNCCTENIIEERLICVAAPKYLAKKSMLKNVNMCDLLNCNLLNNISRPLLWKNYLENLGLKNIDIKYKTGFEHFFMLIEAAKDSLGLALVPDFMIEKELAAGELVKVFNSSFASGYNYQLIYPKQKKGCKKIEDFIHWAKMDLRRSVC